MEKPSYIIGITGGSGAGKTYFLKRLLESFGPDEICLVSQDNYYKPREEQPVDANGVSNFDLPVSINFENLAADLHRLRNGETVEIPEYLFNNKAALPKTLTFKPAPVIVVEGIFVFHYPEVVKQMDLKVFVDAKDHIRVKRRILRDNIERGYGLDDVLYRYEHHVMPAYENYIKPHKYESDIIVNNNKGCENALFALTSFIKNIVHDR